MSQKSIATRPGQVDSQFIVRDISKSHAGKVQLIALLQ